MRKRSRTPHPVRTRAPKISTDDDTVHRGGQARDLETGLFELSDFVSREIPEF